MQDIITDNRIVNIQMVKGDTFSFGIKINGIGQDLDSAYFTCRADGEETNAFQKTLGDGITKDTEKSTEADRYYKCRVAPEDTEGLDAGRYLYDFKIGANSDVFTIMLGVLDIQRSLV